VVRAAAVTYESTAAFFGGKAFVSGNPVRAEFVDLANPAGSGSAHGQSSGVGVLIFGGSQGAHAINVAMVEAAPRLAALGVPLRITHQTGDRDLDMVRRGYAAAGLAADVEPFLYDMGRRIRDADLVVCRAGATTLAELTAAGKPSILIPLPTATDDHQRKNAEALAVAGAAEVLVQADANGEAVARRIESLARDVGRRDQMAAAARRMAKPDAARVIVDRALALAGGG
jgi:UDP-N-acetylglucosamine--N-acetylmuramyl-(pentapeptide) pyrophosphoryl-undecaprenol N-acetylglucosamine transferase